MTDLRRETTIVLSEGDLLDILTEALCRYGSLDRLRATMIAAEGEDFTVSLTPKPEEEAASGN